MTERSSNNNRNSRTPYFAEVANEDTCELIFPAKNHDTLETTRIFFTDVDDTATTTLYQKPQEISVSSSKLNSIIFEEYSGGDDNHSAATAVYTTTSTTTIATADNGIYAPPLPVQDELMSKSHHSEVNENKLRTMGRIEHAIQRLSLPETVISHLRASEIQTIVQYYQQNQPPPSPPPEPAPSSRFRNNIYSFYSTTFNVQTSI